MERFSHTPLQSGHDGLTGRTVNNLAKNGVDTYGALVGLTPQQKLNLDGIGQQGRRQIDYIQEKVEVILVTAADVKKVAAQLDDTDVPPEARHPATPLVFTEADRNPETATLVELAPKYANLSLGQRIEKVRIARGYIQRVDTPQGTPFKKAVRYQDLMRLMRPLCVDWGIRWKPVHSEMLANDQFERTSASGNTKLWIRTLIKVVVRFKCTEDPDFARDGGGHCDHEDLEFIVEGVDDQDKAMSKAYTLADKLAIIRMFNLEYGDDADHTPLNLAPDVPLANQNCIDQIYVLLNADPEIEDPEAHLKAVAAEIGRKISRRVLNEYALPLTSLEAIRNKLQDAAMDTQTAADKPGQTAVGERITATQVLASQEEMRHPKPSEPMPNLTPDERRQIAEMQEAGKALSVQADTEAISEAALTPSGAEHIEIPEADQAKAAAAIAKMDARRAAKQAESSPEPAETQLDHEVAVADEADERLEDKDEQTLGAREQDFLALGDQEFVHPGQDPEQMGSQSNPF